MSGSVIRLGGSFLNNELSLKNLKKYIKSKRGTKIIVVSAIPGLLDDVSQQLQFIFQKDIDFQSFENKILNYYRQTGKKEFSVHYKSITDQLINLLKGISLIGDYSKALKDQVLSYSEKLSVEIAHSQWKKLNGESELLFPEDIDLTTTADFGNATFLSISAEKIKKLEEGIYFLPGSYGINEEGKISRTGFSAADYTAAFLTKVLQTDHLDLWDLDFDFERADPQIIDKPGIISRLTYAEASELAYFEHYSFHPRTVEPLEHEHIPIRIIDSTEGKSAIKTIINTETFIEEQIVKSIACTNDISLLKLDGPGVGLKPGILAKVTSTLNDAGINIKSVITSQTSINIILSKSNGKKALGIIHKLGFSAVTEISLVNDISLIGIVGHGMQNACGVSAKIFTAVANNKINVVLSGSGASDLVSYLVVHKSDKEKSVRAIYKAFFN